ncbi:MAG TPA: sugar ABC transporter substrate-binding protein [Terriglobales bacterium]|nr:sugar ABC transporter substrate-binding protein [Terriglobales bacterium]
MTSGRAVPTIVLLALTAAGPSCAPARRAPPPEEIVFWQPWPSGAIRPLLDDFERSHPGFVVRLRQLPAAMERDSIEAALAAGHAPDLCGIGSPEMCRLLAGGRLADWSAGVADLRDSLRGWELCSVGDALYGVPWLLEPRVLYYEKALFARAGLDSTRAPRTWDELARAAAAVQGLGHGIHGYGIPAGERGALAKDVLSFVCGVGGRVLSEDRRRAVFDSAANVRAIEFYLRVRRAALVASPDSLDREFRSGRLGLLQSGPGLLRRLRQDARGLRYGVAPVPTPAPDSGACWAGGEVLASFNASKHKHEALELARFLVQPPNARRLAVMIGSREPPTAGADSTEYYRARPRERMMVGQLRIACYAPSHPAWGEMEACIDDQVGAALLGGRTAAEVVDSVQARIQALTRH